ncbi:hypothetical protein BIW11_14146, partial [Tropilaelaps mercedesae]
LAVFDLSVFAQRRVTTWQEHDKGFACFTPELLLLLRSIFLVAEPVAHVDAPVVHTVTSANTRGPPSGPAPVPGSPSLPQRRANEEIAVPKGILLPSQRQQQPKTQATVAPQPQRPQRSQLSPETRPSEVTAPKEPTRGHVDGRSASLAAHTHSSQPHETGLSQGSPSTPPVNTECASSPQAKRQAKDLQRMKELLLDSCSFDAQ